MLELVRPLQRKTQSIEAIWATHKEELPVCERTFRKYNALGLCGMSAVYLPSKVRYKSRKKTAQKSTRERIDRKGRRYADFESRYVDTRDDQGAYARNLAVGKTLVEGYERR